jgi:hypothetical protein
MNIRGSGGRLIAPRVLILMTRWLWEASLKRTRNGKQRNLLGKLQGDSQLRAFKFQNDTEST